MRILAITFAFALVGCVDQDITPLGVDDIEESTDEFGPDVLKGDIDGPTTERPSSSPNTVRDPLPVCAFDDLPCLAQQTQTDNKIPVVTPESRR